MTHHYNLRSLRTRWRLSQDDLAQLLGVSQGRVSRLELGEENPSLAIAFGLQVIFGFQPRAYFAKAYAAIEEAVLTRAAPLERAASGRQDFASVKQRHLFNAMMQRATNRDTQ